MLNYIIPLIGSYLRSGISSYILIPVIALAFVATVPCIIMALVRSR